MSEDIDAYKSGQVALQMNFAFIWPGVHADPNVGGDKTGYFANPAGPDGEQFAQLGGQGISVVSALGQAGRGARIHQVVRPARGAGEVVDSSAATRRCSAVVERPGLRHQPALRPDLPRLDGDREGLLGGAELCLAAATPRRSRFHDYVVAGNGTAQEALDGLVEDWTEVFEDDGKM